MKFVSIIILFLFVQGCASVEHKPITDEDQRKVISKTITNSKYEKPNFKIFTAGNALGGAIGAAASGGGNEIIEQNGVSDPAVEISQELAKALAEKHQGQFINNNKSLLEEDDDVEVLVSYYDDVDYILDVKTLVWMFSYFPMDWDNYKFMYSARLRLINATNKNVVAEGLCEYKTEYEDTDKAPSYDELVNNQAAGIKTIVAATAKECVSYFKQETLLM